ncbi:MAG TPA: tyrosine-type recombinase/integrase [Streptosporangiaceae bacterium]|nr:tyrosine-type recombinase/integrase [Streptosporangiaceae bacterium]
MPHHLQAAAGIEGQWTPRELRHTFVSLMSSTGMPVEEIARLVGHSSTHTTEVVYRKELRPVIRSGADAMDKLFPSPESGPAETIACRKNRGHARRDGARTAPGSRPRTRCWPRSARHQSPGRAAVAAPSGFGTPRQADASSWRRAARRPGGRSQQSGAGRGGEA